MTTVEIISLIAASAASNKIIHFDSLIHLSGKKKISRLKIYEALLQNYLFCGFPNALFYLKRFHNLTSFKPEKFQYDFDNLKLKGIETSRKIYGEKLDKLILNVKKFSPELAEWLIVEGYGKVISRSALSIKEREACIISVLVVQMFEEQLISHLYGGLKNGLTVKQIKKIISNLSEIECDTEMNFGLKIFENIIRKKYPKSEK